MNVCVAMTGSQQPVMGVMASQQVAALPSGVIPVSPPPAATVLTTVPAPHGMMGHGHPQPQGIVGAVTQPQLGMMAAVPHTGKIGL